MEERREISRVEYKTNGVVVICDTQEKIYVDVKDISPLGMGICVPEGHEGPMPAPVPTTFIIPPTPRIGAYRIILSIITVTI